jgi:hypothetical protein
MEFKFSQLFHISPPLVVVEALRKRFIAECLLAHFVCAIHFRISDNDSYKCKRLAISDVISALFK